MSQSTDCDSRWPDSTSVTGQKTAVYTQHCSMKAVEIAKASHAYAIRFVKQTSRFVYGPIDLYGLPIMDVCQVTHDWLRLLWSCLPRRIYADIRIDKIEQDRFTTIIRSHQKKPVFSSERIRTGAWRVHMVENGYMRVHGLTDRQGITGCLGIDSEGAERVFVDRLEHFVRGSHRG